MTIYERIELDSVSATLFPDMLMYLIKGSDIHSISELCSRMEQRRYFTFWVTGTENILMFDKLFSQDPVLSRYVGYDECIIPKGEKSKIVLYNYGREVDEYNDTRVKVYLLSQSDRIQILASDNYKDYTGSLFEEVVSTYSR